jgi:hypothetical protein
MRSMVEGDFREQTNRGVIARSAATKQSIVSMTRKPWIASLAIAMTAPIHHALP